MDQSMLTQCTARESGGVRCEVLLTSPDESHNHWISDTTIQAHLHKPFYIHIGVKNYHG